MKTIINVEDDMVNALVFRRLLKDKCQVIHFTDADSCIKALPITKACCFFLDINLGHASMDGVTLMHAIRNTPGYEAVQCYAITALAFPEDRMRLLNQGFNGYLSKPVDMRELDLIIDSLPNPQVDEIQDPI